MIILEPLTFKTSSDITVTVGERWMYTFTSSGVRIVVEIIGQVQTKGSAAIKKVPKIDGIVLGQLPADYHMADEKKILKALGMGLTVPGVTYHMESEIKSSRGSLK